MTARLSLWPIWLLVGLAGALVLGGLRDPIAQNYANADEIAYNSLAISLLRDGTYRVNAQPDGLVATDARFAANPLLYPYLSYASFRIFGISRFSMRLPAMLAFIGAAVTLAALSVRRRLPPLSTVAVLLLFLSCPFLLYAARTARAETLSVVAVYLSCWLSAVGAARAGLTQFALLGSAGAAATVAVWNHPMFAACASLPLFFLVSPNGSTDRRQLRRAFVLWIAGAAVALIGLIAVFVLPHLDAWREQFLLNAATITEAGRNPTSDRLHFDPFKLAADLRARFSTFGKPYLLWYLAVPLVIFGFFRLNRRLALAATITVGWLLVSAHITITAVTYVIHFVAMLPLLALLGTPREPAVTVQGRRLMVATGLASLLIGVHGALVFMPTFESRAFADHEAEFRRTLATLPGSGPISGPLEAAIPAWQANRRYFMPDPPFFDIQPGVEPRYRHLVREQTEWFLQSDGSARSTPP